MDAKPIGDRGIRRLAWLFAIVVLSVLAAANSEAADLDLRGGVYTDLSKPFVGAGLLSWIAPSFYFNPNVEYVFVNNGTFATFNFDAHYDLPTGHRAPYLWLGAGLGVVYSNPDGPDNSATDARLNLIGGVGLRGHGYVPYVQAKYITGQKEWVLAAGIRF
jgi:hypothetical protein